MIVEYCRVLIQYLKFYGTGFFMVLSVKVLPYMFVCKMCVMRHIYLNFQRTWVCDGVQDCSTGEDEDNCVVTCDAELQFTCPMNNDTGSRGLLPSHSSRASPPCIARKHVCDGKNDCPRGDGNCSNISNSNLKI